MIPTWIALAVATGALGILFWRYYIRPYLFPMEGVEKLAFVVWSWGSGGALVWLAPSVRYWLASLLLGLGLLLWGSWSTWGVWQRWRLDRIMFQPAAPIPMPQSAEERRAA